MGNHFHLVVRVPDDPDPTRLLGDFQAYAARRLNREFGRPVSDEWWTEGGSKRKLKDDAAVAAAVNYVLFKQHRPLVVWCPERGRLV